MAILEPEIAILDETDSGLDIDALGVVTRGIHEIRRIRPQLAAVVVTHYHRVLEELQPQRVHLLVDGRIAQSGGLELADRIEQEGYDAWRP
jgi:Fe-S cluster assembly ATP-binding protein